MSNDKKKGLAYAFRTNKKLRYGGLATLLTAIVVLLTLAFNFGLSVLGENWNLDVDMTRNRLYTLSAQTKDLVGKTEGEVYIYAMYPSSTADTDIVLMMLENYRRLDPARIHVERVDPTRNPGFANQFVDEGQTMADGTIVVANAGNSVYRSIAQADMYTYSSGALQAFTGEQAVTNAIIYATANEQQKVYYLTGLQSPTFESVSFLSAYLESERVQFLELGYLNVDALQSHDILMVASPQKDIPEEQRLILKKFLTGGGKMLYLSQAGDPELVNFESLIKLYDVAFNRDLVFEREEANFFRAPNVIVPSLVEHELTASMSQAGLSVVLPNARSFIWTDLSRLAYTAKPLLTSSATSYSRTDLTNLSTNVIESDVTGSSVVGYALAHLTTQSGDMDTKIVLLGSSQFITDSAYASYAGNLELFLNSVNWLQDKETVISIVGKDLVGNTLTFSNSVQMLLLVGIVLIAMPVVVFVVGAVVWSKRRHL